MKESYDSRRPGGGRRAGDTAILTGEFGFLIGIICGGICGIIFAVMNVQTCSCAGWLMPEGNMSLLWSFYGASFGGVIGGGLGTVIGLMKCCTGFGLIVGASGGLIAAQVLALFNLSCSDSAFTDSVLSLLGGSLMGLIIGLINKHLFQINQREAVN
jgi:uncharacterized protein YqgC (DUF456 family)